MEGVRDSRNALEKVLGMSVERYIEGIDDRRMQRNTSFGLADEVSVSEVEMELADLLRSVYL